MTNRDRFEQWILTRTLCTKYHAPLTKHTDGSYKDLRVRSAWATWKAASELKQEQCAQVCTRELDGMPGRIAAAAIRALQ